MHWQRILDVNLNRTTESLKFIEDYVRFSLENSRLLTSIRKVRSEFLKVKREIPLRDLILYRKSEEDLGRRSGFDKKSRFEEREPVIANLNRLKESIRTMEEILRLKNPYLSDRLKEMRFQIYDLEKAIFQFSRRDFNPQNYAILDEKYLEIMPLKRLISTLQNWATMIQLRVKEKSDREFLSLAKRMRELITKSSVKFIINNRVDITLGSNADGVHLGQKDLPVGKARDILGDGYIIGASVHNIDEARRAQRDGADYLGVGAIFPTRTKSDAVVCGLKRLSVICRMSRIPVVGIGGINGKNYKKVLDAGASGIAVSSYIFEGDLEKNLRSLSVKKAKL